MRFTLRWGSASRLPTIMVEQREHRRTASSGISGRLPCPSDEEHAHHRGEGGRLHARAHQRGHRGGRALVDVRRPHVERHRRHLEGEAGARPARCRTYDERPRSAGATARGQGRAISASAWCSGGAVEQRRAVEQHARSEKAPRMKYLKPASAGRGPRRRYAGERVGGDRHHLEVDEEGDELVGERQQAHARGREEHQRVELAALGVALLQEPRREQRRERQRPGRPSAVMKLENGSSTAKPWNTSRRGLEGSCRAPRRRPARWWRPSASAW